MIFQAKWNNTGYLLRKSRWAYHEGLGKELIPGLWAKFRGPQRLFDSELAQMTNGWTDEEREYVEKRLLEHKDFGSGLYLAPGESLTDEQKALVKNKEAIAEKRTRCQKFWPEGGEIVQCREIATVGREYCTEHDPSEVKITKGMATTAD